MFFNLVFRSSIGLKSVGVISEHKIDDAKTRKAPSSFDSHHHFGHDARYLVRRLYTATIGLRQFPRLGH